VSTAATIDDAVVVGVVAVHPERTGDPRTLRWCTARPGRSDDAGGTTDDGSGVGTDAPTPLDPALAALVEAGVLTSAEVGPGQVLTTLAAGHDWPSAAAAVRAAVQAAVARHGSRRSAGSGAAPTDPDAALHRIATQVLRTEVGPYAAGHGGGVELLAVHDGVVDVRMVGACHGCPAAGWTVQARLERHLRDEAPWTVGVRIVDRPAR